MSDIVYQLRKIIERVTAHIERVTAQRDALAETYSKDMEEKDARIEEKDARVERLREERDGAMADYQDIGKELYKAMNRIAELGGLHIITDAQIDAAWGILSNWGEDYADTVIAKAVSSSLEAALKELGVVQCEECEGLGHYQEIERHEWVDCPECNGHGWRKE